MTPHSARTGVEILPVWRDHRGDGPVRAYPAGAATPELVGQAVEGAGQRLTELVGSRQAGPVQIYLFGPGQKESMPAGVALAQAIGIELEQDLRGFLGREPTSTLVLAMCPTDRISRRTPPRRKGRRR